MWEGNYLQNDIIAEKLSRVSLLIVKLACEQISVMD